MRPIVVFGTGDIAELAHFYFSHDAQRRVAAFTADGAYVKEDSFCGLPVVAFEEVADRFAPADHDMFVAVSYARINALRAEKYRQARERGYELATYVSSRATTWPGLHVGRNCFILEDNTVQPFVTIGDNVTLWSGNHVGHHARIEDHCFITSHVVISGGVTVKQNAFIGVNSTLRDHITIGRSCVIGAGSLVLQDTADFSVYTQPAATLSKVPSNRLRSL
jgi:sugar O-acyltransferase (sialic acid O-acetyltransferase NeuD family)